MKPLLLSLLIGTAAFSAQAADININLGNVRVNVPGTGVTVTFGSRNESGHYWDGQEWRNEKYWHKHNGPRGEKHYTGHGNRGRNEGEQRGHCPPGQAKKGNCRAPPPSHGHCATRGATGCLCGSHAWAHAEQPGNF